MEEWKDIKGYEGKYQVSNLGRVRSLDRVIEVMNILFGSQIRYFKGRILKQYKRGEYLVVSLSTNGVGKYVSVHRLVAIAFVPNPNGYPIVNHKDENKLNNCVENLEWCTQGYNNNYGTRNKKVSEALTNGKTSKNVYQYTIEGELVNIWQSTNEAERNGFVHSHISECCNGKRKIYKGYKWSFEPL